MSQVTSFINSFYLSIHNTFPNVSWKQNVKMMYNIKWQKKGHKHHMHQNMSEFAKEHRSVKCNTRWRRQYYSVWSKLNEISAIVLGACAIHCKHFGTVHVHKLSYYRTRAIISRSWLEAALEYTPYIRTEFSKKPP